MNRLYFKSREDFRNWLSENHSKEESIWIEYFKDGSKGINYNESLEEALCFGWIDSLIKKVDERIYLRRFSPRRSKSIWSKVNKNLVEKLISEGKMTKYGMEKIEAAKKNGTWESNKKELTREEKNKTINEFREIIVTDDEMIKLFDEKGEKTKLLFANYYFDARTEKTRQRRITRIYNFMTGKINIL